MRHATIVLVPEDCVQKAYAHDRAGDRAHLFSPAARPGSMAI